MLLFLLCAALFSGICLIGNRYPFGTVNNIVDDEYLQYIDFFCWLKNALTGNGSLFYSAAKSLGGNTVALFAYYLSSPFHLLVLFFDYTDMQLCVFLMTALKLSTAAVTAALFLRCRFDALHRYAAGLLALCYALSIYSVGQSANIMWLDGVYMLPLVLLAAYRFLQTGNGGMLAVTVGLSILFNWYTGYMICLFVPLYFLAELATAQKGIGKIHVGKTVGGFARFCLYELWGVLLSFALFLPNAYSLLQGKGAAEDGIFKFAVEVKLPEFFDALHVGTWRIMLYCGIVVALLCLLFFMSRCIRRYEKVFFGALFAFMLALFCFTPIANIYNGFRFAASFKYRFAFLPIFVTVFLAAYLLDRSKNRVWAQRPTGAALLLGIGFVFYDFVAGMDQKQLWISLAVTAAYPFCFRLMESPRVAVRRTVAVFMALTVFFELAVSGRNILRLLANYDPDAAAYSNTLAAETELTEAVKAQDNGTYRLNTFAAKEIAKANGGMAYGYLTVSHYSSSFDSKTSDLLTHLGYSSEPCPSLVDLSILPADALLGIKYALTKADNPFAYPGYEKTALQNDTYAVAQNTYALPLAFAVKSNADEPAYDGNPFLYMNALYSSILGREVALFTALPSEKTVSENGDLLFSCPAAGSNEVYGYIELTKDYGANTVLFTDGIQQGNYGGWLYCPVQYLGSGTTAHTMELRDCTAKQGDITAQFYVLDMTLFETVIRELQSGAPSTLHIEDGHITAALTADTPQRLMFTVPYADGWTATVNGEKTQITTSCGLFMTVEVPAGTAQVELHFEAPWLRLGVTVSVVSAVLLILLTVIKRKKRKTV